jgi:hypothetical protein
MSGLTFREVMTGQLSLREPDPRKGYRKPGSVGIAFRARVEIADIAAFLADPQHPGVLITNVEVPRWGAQLPDATGRFALFAPVAAQPGCESFRSPGTPKRLTADDRSRGTQMIYETPVLINGEPHRLCGVKELRIAGPWRLWPATTTLFVEVRQGADGVGAVVGSGILRLSLSGFVAMLATMRGTGGPLRQVAVVRFMVFFVRGLVATYLLRRLP